MIRSFSPVKSVMTLIALGAVTSILIGADPASAQSMGMGSVSKNIAVNIAVLPKLIAVIAYVIAAFFAATGLLKLKDWMTAPEKNPLQAALFRIIVAALLLVFPHVWIIVNTTFFGGTSTGTQSSDKKVMMQSLRAF